ncbi:MAG: hypothetical protein AAB320_04315 [Elusimicrobiota bacterium]
MKKLSMIAVLFGFTVGQASAQSFENTMAREFQEISKNAGQIRAAFLRRSPLSSQSAAAPVTPAKGFNGTFKCGNRPQFSIKLNNDGTVTINGDQLATDGADHPYQGIQYNNTFVDANTLKMRSFGKLNGYDIDGHITLKISEDSKTLAVSRNDKTSVNGRRIGVDESFTCSRSFWNTW